MAFVRIHDGDGDGDGEEKEKGDLKRRDERRRWFKAIDGSGGKRAVVWMDEVVTTEVGQFDYSRSCNGGIEKHRSS
ncbi:hypothetical protein Syun_012841 [Stephania yunnanensis]|uniref:Uncharacterized protein n=1 Tax=Stephania yunnanensis TaxID=152371 RepID=A0AAP0PJU6_9MAGN